MPDFKPRHQTLSITKKRELGFDPKNYQERTIPIPMKLVGLLEEKRKRQDKDEYLIFGTSRHNEMKGCPGGQRDKHMFDVLKRLALRAEANCGKCVSTYLNQDSSCETRPICRRFGLHMFREHVRHNTPARWRRFGEPAKAFRPRRSREHEEVFTRTRPSGPVKEN